MVEKEVKESAEVVPVEEVKTPTQQVADVTKNYLIPSGVTALALSVVLEYFFHLPNLVASSLSILIFAVVNGFLVLIVEKLKK
jgi:cation transport ATPase